MLEYFFLKSGRDKDDRVGCPCWKRKKPNQDQEKGGREKLTDEIEERRRQLASESLPKKKPCFFPEDIKKRKNARVGCPCLKMKKPS